MLDKVTRKHIDQALRDQPNAGAQQIGASADIAQGKAEIDDIGRYDVYSATEYNGPDTVFPDPFVDAFDQLFLPVLFAEIRGKDRPDHEKGGHDRKDVDSPADEQCRGEVHEETHGHAQVKNGEPAQCAKQC